MTSSDALDAARRFRSTRQWEIITDFRDLLRVPNVTGHTELLKANADAIADRFRRRGATMDVIEMPGVAPVVIGSLRTENPTATLGVYVHYDGQPVDESAWTAPPFDAVLASAPWHEGGVAVESEDSEVDPEWRIYARGASDDKAPFAALCAALDALAESALERSVDLVFLFEGEEESGSPNLEAFMTDLADRLQVDAWLLCDGPVHQSRRPQVAFGVRGYSGFDLTFFGPFRELHSGHYGNWVPNPAFDLAGFIASCKDDSGRVVIPGFYDDTVAITDADRAAIAAMPDIESDLLAELGVGEAELPNSPLLERLLLPSFNVRGLRAADVGDDARNVIPAEASVSIDMRLAAGCDPGRMVDLVAEFLRGQDYLVLDRDPTPEERRSHRRVARLDRSPGYRAVRIPMESALAETLIEVCSEAVDGGPVVALPTFGGSMPLFLFEDILNAPVVILPIANHDNNQHSADENIRVANLWYGIDMWSVLLTSDFGGVSRQGL